MSKHQAILDYLEKLPIGKRVSVRSISNYLQVSDGTAYREKKGWNESSTSFISGP